MKEKNLREWLFNNKLEDFWYVCTDGHLFRDLMTLDQVAEYVHNHPTIKLQLLHPSMTEMNNPPWIIFEDEERQEPSEKSPSQQPASHTDPSGAHKAMAGKRGITRVPVPILAGTTGSLTTLQRSRRFRKVPNPNASLIKAFIFFGISCIIGASVYFYYESQKLSPAELPTSEMAYEQAQHFLDQHLGSQGKVIFPEISAKDVSIRQLTDTRFRITGYVCIKGTHSSTLPKYELITEMSPEKEWALLYLKSGDTEIGMPPSAPNQGQLLLPEALPPADGES